MPCGEGVFVVYTQSNLQRRLALKQCSWQLGQETILKRAYTYRHQNYIEAYHTIPKVVEVSVDDEELKASQSWVGHHAYDRPLKRNPSLAWYGWAHYLYALLNILTLLTVYLNSNPNKSWNWWTSMKSVSNFSSIWNQNRNIIIIFKKKIALMRHSVFTGFLLKFYSHINY